MPTLTFKTKYKKLQGIALSSTELVEGFLFGIPLTNAQGVSLSTKVIEDKIAIAQRQLETTLAIKFGYQEIIEDKDFVAEEYKNWGFMKMNFPVKKVLKIEGYVGEQKTVDFPLMWISTSNQSEEYLTSRTINLVPNGSGGLISTRNFVGIFPQLSLHGADSIPAYWKIKYLTGFQEVPVDLIDFVGKLAAIQCLGILGNLPLMPGITSQSLSFDGLSQSVSTSKSANSTAYSATIRQYTEELRNQLQTLINNYKGISFTTL